VNILGKIAALGTEPDRQQFLEDLFAFMEYRGTPITTVPVICRQTVDLYRLYHHVKERSGMVEVWTSCSRHAGLAVCVLEYRPKEVRDSVSTFCYSRKMGRILTPWPRVLDVAHCLSTPAFHCLSHRKI